MSAPAGRMLWLRRNTLPGSYLCLTPASRRYVAAGYAAATSASVDGRGALSSCDGSKLFLVSMDAGTRGPVPQGVTALIPREDAPGGGRERAAFDPMATRLG